MVKKNSSNLFIIVIAGLVVLSLMGGGLLSILPLNNVYIPKYADIQCVQGNQNQILFSQEQTIPGSGGFRAYNCNAQTCDLTHVYSNKPYLSVDTGSGYIAYSNTPSTIEGNFYVYDVPDVTLEHNQAVFVRNDVADLPWPFNSDKIVKVKWSNDEAHLNVIGQDGNFPSYSLSSDFCSWGGQNLPPVEEGFSGDGSTTDTSSPWNVGEIRTFVYAFADNNLAVFTNSQNEICYQSKIGWETRQEGAITVLDIVGGGGTNVDACSTSECIAQNGAGWFVTDDWQCTTDVQEAVCTTNADAGGTQCINGNFVHYTCVNGQIEVDETNDACCSTNNDCPTDLPICANNVCKADNLIYETCNIGQCCIGINDAGYDPSLNSIYKHGRACDVGQFCNIGENNFLGTCSLIDDGDSGASGTCDEGDTRTCSIGNEAGVRTCDEDGTWGECVTSGAGSGFPIIWLLIGGGAFFMLILLLDVLKKK